MGRNGYIGSPADLHRVNDFNYDQNQDRGPLNALALAYSGFPLVYPDIVGGTFGENRFDVSVTPRMKTYIMRNAQWASVHPSMSMGQGPWTFEDEQVERVMLEAAQLHDRLHPYFFSQAIRFYRDGYPWTMTPLPIAFPEDEKAHGRENDRVRGYQWMIGDSLMAVPLYGNDYETAASRDVYLPAGTWIDYDTGERYQGPKLLKDFPLPVGKTPLFAGGTGVVIEKVQSGDSQRSPLHAALAGRFYPVASEGQTEFWDSSGDRRSIITVRVRDPKNPEVFDQTTGNPVEGKWVRHAWQFPFEAGHNYEIR
ncbi:MAG: hypothetical protein ACRD7E_32640, partial [Bryobacteraceae bacterium]